MISLFILYRRQMLKEFFNSCCIITSQAILIILKALKIFVIIVCTLIFYAEVAKVVTAGL